MKRFISTITVVLFILLLGFNANAASDITILLDGKPLQYDSEYGYPYIDGNGRTQVPLRKTMEAFGCTVNWDNVKSEAILSMGDTTVIVPVGKNYIVANGITKQIDTAAQIKDGRIFLPIRPVIESFKGKVEWDAGNMSVNIANSQGDGFLISDISINNKGELVIITNSGKEMNLGRVRGKDGDDGSDDRNGTSSFSTFASYEEGTRFYNLYPNSQFDCFVMKDGVKYNVTITEAYYELISINDIEDESAWDFIEHETGWYQYRPFDINIVIEGYTNPILSGDEININYTSGSAKGIVLNDGSFEIVGNSVNWIYPQAQYFQRATLRTDIIHDLNDLEDKLNDDYVHIEGLDIKDIILLGDEEEIEVEIYLDLSGEWDFDYWTNQISDGEIVDFLQDMVDDILDSYPDADITGLIENESDRSILVNFTITSRGLVVIDRTDSSDGITDISELEDYINDEYDRIDTIYIEDIVLAGDEDSIRIEIHVDLTDPDDYEDWFLLRDSDIEDFLQDMVDDILNEFPDADITGFFEDDYDSSKLLSFEVESSGNVTFRSYFTGGNSYTVTTDGGIEVVESSTSLYEARGKLWVPLRFVADAFGWDVTFDSTLIQSTISDGYDSVTIGIDSPYLVINDSTSFCDLDYVCTVLGYGLTWNLRYNAITISKIH